MAELENFAKWPAELEKKLSQKTTVRMYNE